MALRTFVFVSGINNLSDARYCAGMEVDQLGFHIEKDHPNYTAPDKFTEMAEWLSGVDFVAEVSSPQATFENITDYDVQTIKIENLDQVDVALGTGLDVVFATTDVSTARKAWSFSGENLSYVLFSGPVDQAIELANEMPVVATEGISPETINELLDKSKLKGIGLEGGDEIRPGFKDFDELADILEALEIDDLG